jgi:hypothetical protein
MKRRISTFVLALLLAVGIIYAASGRSKQSKPYTSTPGMGMNARVSALTQEEQEKLYQTKLDYEKKVTPIRAEIRVLNLEIDDMIRAGKSGKELNSYVDKLNNLKAELSKERVAHRVAVREAVGEEKYQQYGMRRYAAGNRSDTGRNTPRFEGKYQNDRAYRNRNDANCPYGYTPRRNERYERRR